MIFINMSKRVYNNRKIIFGNFLFAIIYRFIEILVVNIFDICLFKYNYEN